MSQALYVSLPTRALPLGVCVVGVMDKEITKFGSQINHLGYEHITKQKVMHLIPTQDSTLEYSGEWTFARDRIMSTACRERRGVRQGHRHTYSLPH